MSDAGYKRWANTEWWQEGYERLWLGQRGVTQDDRETGESKNQQESGNVDESKREDEPKESQGMEIESGAGETENDIQKNVVYLTADSEEELTELKEDEIYIIGGICDHNRYKVSALLQTVSSRPSPRLMFMQSLCLNKAKDSGIRTARLPIGRYLASLPTRKVLTVNQVFEILIRWVETKDWEEALYSVIPKRKFQGSGKGKDIDAVGKQEQEQAVGEVVDGQSDENASALSSQHLIGR